MHDSARKCIYRGACHEFLGSHSMRQALLDYITLRVEKEGSGVFIKMGETTLVN